MTNPMKDAILSAAMAHVPFDGWSEATLRAAIADSGVADGLARALFPRGALDLALAYHEQGDAQMRAALAAADLSGMKFREKIAHAVRLRLEAADKEAVRRGTTFFALPQNAVHGTKAIWGTADAIWSALGDSTRDFSWYTKRATLSGVYGSTVLYWLGDDSPGQENTWAFLDRRIEDVMQFEKFKSAFGANPLGKALTDGPLAWLNRMRAPIVPPDMPGSFRNGPFGPRQ
ncbi:MAG: COQ9 family protein [Rhodobacteraceae bacterium]|jgi:ubiquinone biosynthesis protein COQ9|nr:COQ9 family protein [Paracoccaceae bacterium]